MGHVRSIKPGLLRFSVPPPPLFFYANVKISLCSKHLDRFLKTPAAVAGITLACIHQSINVRLHLDQSLRTDATHGSFGAGREPTLK